MAPMDAAERFTSILRRVSATSRIACVITQRSISLINPKRSATGRNVPGRMISALATNHPEQEFLARVSLPERHDRLGVQH